MSKNKLTTITFGLLMLCSSCYNGLNTTEDSTIELGEQPITIRPTINTTTTRVQNNRFESSDCIGLFLKANSNNQLLLDNTIFEYSKGNIFISHDEAFYPKDKGESTVYAYYPYLKSRKIDKDNNISISIPTNQSTIDKLNKSDFLLAYKNDVRSSKVSLSLKFNHLLTKIGISLEIDDSATPQDLLKLNPIVRLINFPTKGKYNLITEEFTQLNTMNQIQPINDWQLAEKSVTGCEAIVFPSLITSDQQIQIEAEGIVYKCDFTADYSLQPGTINHIRIKYTPSKGFEISGVESDINQWEEGGDINIDMKPLLDAISINSINFKETNLVILENAEKVERAILTKELLMSENIDCIATTIYPIKGNKPDFSNGYILAVENEKYNNLLSAKINWSDSGLKISKNDTPVIRYIFIDKEGKICFEQPEESEIIRLKDYFIEDRRNEEFNKYPLIKIGSQIIMKTNLSTSYYTDGTKLAKGTGNYVVTAGYLTSKINPEEKLYNMSALKSEKALCPEGWKIPTVEQFKELSTFVNDKLTYILEKGEIEGEYNRTGLTLKIIGAYSNDAYNETNSSHWLLNSKDNLLYSIVFNSTRAPYSKVVNNEEKKVLSIRCIKN